MSFFSLNSQIPIYMQHYINKKNGIKESNEPKMTEKERKEKLFKDKINDIKNADDGKKKVVSSKELSINDYIELLKEEGNRHFYIELLESLKDE